MKVIFTWKELIVVNGMKEIARYPASSKVRNEVNGQRKPDQVEFTIPRNMKSTPYYPRPFPSGIFRITGIEWINNDTARYKKYGPVIIKTDATREVFTWELNQDGNYWKPTGKTQIDTAYYIHHTHRYLTTLGCIRGGDLESEMISLARIIEPVMKHSEILLEVL